MTENGDPASQPNKVALIIGVTGQDGSYLAELLLSKGYVVHGTIRRSSSFNTSRIEHLYQDPHDCSRRLLLHYGDLLDGGRLRDILRQVRPDEIYNLGAQTHVKVSFEIPEYTADVDALGPLRLLEAVRSCGLIDVTRIYQASSGEMFGDSPAPQSEATPFRPRSPYAVAKQFAHQICVNYRQAYRVHISAGLLFNHESPRRGPTFVTRKVAAAVARIARGLQEVVYLGNLDAQRDWGYAKDYVEAMWLMLQRAEPDDYVIATGESHSVREFVEKAFARIGETMVWDGTGLEEVGRCSSSGVVRVRVDPTYFRPTEVDHLCGDASKARVHLGWRPKTAFDELVHMMVDAELAHLDG